MTQLVALTAAQAPAASQQALAQQKAAGTSLSSNFSDGIRDAFPLLSIKGGRFHFRLAGQNQPILDPHTNAPVSFLDVVLVNASRLLSKTYYIKGYDEGDLNPPDCWSLDSVRPDSSVLNKVSPVCQGCPMNEFGSKITPAGKKAKACQDARRVAVLMPHQLGQAEPQMLLLRVPQSSLKNLKQHVQLIERHGFLPHACVTRLQFDPTPAFPKLLFNFARPLNDQEFQLADQLRTSEQSKAMLDAPDFDDVASVHPQQTGQMHGFAPQAAPVVGEAEASVQNNLSQPVHAQPIEAAPVVHEVKSTVIELPDGKLFDTATGEYIERKQPEIPMPELDPNTLKLPEGTFFNTVTRQYVTGPEKGAPIATPPQPVTRERKARGRPKAEVKPDPTPAPEPAPVVAEQAPVVGPVEKPVAQAKPANGTDDSDDVKPVVSQSVPELDAILSKFKVPTS